MKRLLPCLLAAASFVPTVRAAEPFRLQDGDRVVFLGNTPIEREQRYGYWETLLTLRHPGKKLVFRNLGWSGDTVWGEARAGFGTAADGFKHLKEHVLSLKPTVIFVGYGSNESFEGDAGLEKFVKGYNALLDALAPAKAQMVLLAPLCQEDLGAPLPSADAQNRNLEKYSKAIREIAEKRECRFVDLFALSRELSKAGKLTDNGIHPTEAGYWRLAAALERGLGLSSPERLLAVATGGTVKSFMGGKAVVSKSGNEATVVTVEDDFLPDPSGPGGASLPGRERVLRVMGLQPGDYSLEAGGARARRVTADELAKGVKLTAGVEFTQVEALRKAIRDKNQLYFHRWRPQNETYLFGFRKHEQGQNAREIPQFDPLVEAKEKEIATLSVSPKRRYTLTPERKGGQQ